MTAAVATLPVSPSARQSELPVAPMFLDRWSPRAFKPDPLSPREVATLFEAARWAPSGGNSQPWLFLYADTPEELPRFQALLVDANRLWADRAPLLAILFARRKNRGEENRWAPFDAGAAWMALALQARQMGLHAHAMAGFHEDQAYQALGLDPAEWKAMVAIAVGRHGDPAQLPDNLRARETPSDRKPLSEVAQRFGATLPG
jgi:nitroreductase